MKSFLRFGLLIAVLPWLRGQAPSPAAAPPPPLAPAAEKELWLAELQWHQAYLDGNAAELRRLETNDFLRTEPDGMPIPKPIDLERLSRDKYQVLALHDATVVSNGNTALITGKLARVRTTARVSSEGLFAVADTLIKGETGWQVLSSAETMITPSSHLTTTAWPRDARWEKRHEGFLADARTMSPDLLFLGDSITDFWRNRGKSVFQATWNTQSTLNLGLSGDRTGQVLWRIAHGELDGLHPKVVMLMIGTNDLGKERDSRTPRSSTADVVAGIQSIVAAIQTKLPSSRILLLGIFPRSHLASDPIRQAAADVNRQLAVWKSGPRVQYLDIGQQFLNPDGSLDPKIMPDYLHPTNAGYEIWARAVRNPLAKLMAVGS